MENMILSKDMTLVIQKTEKRDQTCSDAQICDLKKNSEILKGAIDL